MTELVGKVYLVGAGPGDPGLLTIKGKILLESADVVIYDALVSPEILAIISPHAEKIDALSEDEAWKYLCEENVKMQVNVLENLPLVQEVWANHQPLAIHGWIYSISDGILCDLNCTCKAGYFPEEGQEDVIPSPI